MARTTEEAVAGIIEVQANIPLAPFIETANALVTDACGEFDYTDAKLELIERWLSAHFYAQRDPRASSEQAKGVGASYQSSVSLGFDNTHYGQMAMRLDTEGGLASLNEKAKKGRRRGRVAWIGGDVPYDDEE